MVLHRSAHYAALRAWWGPVVAAIYSAGLVSATALLMAVLQAHEPDLMFDANSNPLTMTEMAMHDAAERTLASPKTALLANERPNDWN